MTDLLWHRVADLDELPEGRVKTVSAGHDSLALTHYDGRYGALSNRCPHQGGPLGEGTIENGLLRCRGTATTTARSPAARSSATACRGSRSRSARTESGSAWRRTCRTCARSATRWWRRWSPGASGT